MDGDRDYLPVRTRFPIRTTSLTGLLIVLVKLFYIIGDIRTKRHLRASFPIIDVGEFAVDRSPDFGLFCRRSELRHACQCVSGVRLIWDRVFSLTAISLLCLYGEIAFRQAILRLS